jgi:ABC-type dipeptide/oligopeptide/nickel transport system permease subunit
MVVCISSSIGILLGLLAGYLGSWVNNIIMRVIDAMMCLPPIVLALVLGSALGGGLKNIMISLGISLMPGYCRLMCGQALSIKQNDYITASRAMGANDGHIIFFHLLRNAFPPMLVLITIQMGTAILAEAGLSFLGLGISPPDPALGSMVSENYKYLRSNPILSFAPGIVVMLAVISFNMVGDGVRDALDPKLRGSI